MRVILSRKGFDSEYGGHPSIIFPNGEMLTLPIPSAENGIPYSSIKTRKGKNLLDVMKRTYDSIKLKGTKIELGQHSLCHLDPDITFESVERAAGWRGAFGQADAALGTLRNKNVSEGDLFLFFGWFNECYSEGSECKLVKGDGKHTIFGYLQIDKIIYPHKDEVPTWLKGHPHLDSKSEKNCIFIARETCTFNENIKGYGMLKYSKELDLTKQGLTKSRWDLPYIFRNVEIGYHNEECWKDGYFQSRGRGQEFVIEENENIENWAIRLIENNAHKSEERELN